MSSREVDVVSPTAHDVTFREGPLGMTLYTDPYDGKHHVKHVTAGGQAEAQGAEDQDLILSIAGTTVGKAPPYGSMSHTNVLALFKAATRPLKITVSREAPPKPPPPAPPTPQQYTLSGGKKELVIGPHRGSIGDHTSPPKIDKLPSRNGVISNHDPVVNTTPKLSAARVDTDKSPLLAMVSGFKHVVILHEDETVMVVMAPHPYGPLTKGHCLLFPKKQYKSIESMPEEEIASCFKILPTMIRAVKEATGVTECTVVTKDKGKTAEESEHVHFHIIPRYPNDRIFLKDMLEDQEVGTTTQCNNTIYHVP
jgi:histidine triad (HIT) family protein